MGGDWTENTTALKTLVWVMTGLLVLALGLFVYGMARTAGEVPGETAKLRLELPAGHRLEDAALSDDRLLLRLAPTAGEGARLLVVDLASGRTLADVLLAPAP